MAILISIATVLLLLPNPNTLASSEFSCQNENGQEETCTSYDGISNHLFGFLAPNDAYEETPVGNSNQPDPYWISTDALYRGYLYATIAGVFGGIIGVIFLIKQTMAIESQS